MNQGNRTLTDDLNPILSTRKFYRLYSYSTLHFMLRAESSISTFTLFIRIIIFSLDEDYHQHNENPSSEGGDIFIRRILIKNIIGSFVKFTKRPQCDSPIVAITFLLKHVIFKLRILFFHTSHSLYSVINLRRPYIVRLLVRKT